MKVTFALLLLSAHSLAWGWGEPSILELYIIKIGSFDELAEFTQEATTTRDEHSGLSLATKADVIAYAIPSETLGSTSFEIGEHVILCFESRHGGYIKIFDYTPNGDTHQLFPLEGSAWVEGGQMYCAGDQNSNAQFYADGASGTGNGRLWINLSDSPDQIGTAEAWVTYHVRPGAHELAPTEADHAHDETTQGAEPEPEAEPELDAHDDPDDAGSQSRDQALRVTPACFSGTLNVTYLQHIGLTEDASLHITIDDQLDCGPTEPLPPTRMTIALHGRQVPLPIHITCAAGSTITIDIHERDLTVFTTTSPCDTLHDHAELILTPVATTRTQPDTTLALSSHQQARDVIERITTSVGVAPNFVIYESTATSFVLAAMREHERFIFYNPEFMRRAAANEWIPLAILAHEIGHHVNGHLPVTRPQHEIELEADHFSGFVLARLGATLEQAQAALHEHASDTATPTHSAKRERLVAVERGWTTANRNGSHPTTP